MNRESRTIQPLLLPGEQALAQGHMLFAGMDAEALQQTLALLQAVKRDCMI